MSSKLILPMQKHNISLLRGKAAPLENIRNIISCFEESSFETEKRRQECICMMYAERQVNIYLSKYNWKCSGSFPVDLFLFCEHCFHTCLCILSLLFPSSHANYTNVVTILQVCLSTASMEYFLDLPFLDHDLSHG